MYVQFNPWGNTMKMLILSALLAGAALSGAAHAGEFTNTTGWGHTSAGNTGRSSNHYNQGAIAGQVEDAIQGNLTSRPTYITNQAIGNMTQIEIHGDGNNVSTDSTNTGNVGAQQGVGKGGIRQSIQQ
jgi:hypothetical protein